MPKNDGRNSRGAEPARVEAARRRHAPSLGESVYLELKGAIRDGAYHPGERVREAEIAARLGVSRTPVREAFRRLQSEGLLGFEPQRGVVVAELDRQHVTELFAVRQYMEGMAARFAAQHGTEAEIEGLGRILARARDATDDLRAFSQINWEFHHTIVAAARNRFVSQMFASLADSLALLRGARFIPPGREHEILNEHQAIVDAIAGRDPDGADEAAQHHVHQAVRAYLRSLLERAADGGRQSE